MAFYAPNKFNSGPDIFSIFGEKESSSVFCAESRSSETTS